MVDAGAKRGWRERCSLLTPRAADPWSGDERAWFDEVYRWTIDSGLEIERDALLHLHLSAKVSPLVALFGPPGVGKSSLARAYAQALGASLAGGELVRIPVEASWTESARLHGAPGGHPTPFLELAFRAETRQDELFVAVLEEWNLAHVDYYLSQIIAAMSDDGMLSVCDGERIAVPIQPGRHRLFVFGTMNVDEAGTLLTDKVLDRCGIVELPPTAPNDFISSRLSPAAPPRRLPAASWIDLCRVPDRLPVPPELKKLWAVLSEWADPMRADLRFVFGHRALRDMCAYTFHAQALDPEWAARHALDLQLCQRILPRIRGDESIGRLLERLEVFAEEHQYEATRARIGRMRAQLDTVRVASFWTA